MATPPPDPEVPARDPDDLTATEVSGGVRTGRMRYVLIGAIVLASLLVLLFTAVLGRRDRVADGPQDAPVGQRSVPLTPPGSPPVDTRTSPGFGADTPGIGPRAGPPEAATAPGELSPTESVASGLPPS